jgi:hypothetical protein
LKEKTMIEIRADREKVIIEHDSKERTIAAGHYQAPYQRPVRIRAEDEMSAAVITLRWSKRAGQVKVTIERGQSSCELMSTDVQDGESPSGVILKVYTGLGKYRVSRLRRRG